MKKVLPSLLEIYNILDQDDSQKGFSNVSSSPSAFQVSETTPVVNDQTACYVQSGPNKGRPICNFCKRPGHIAEHCYKKHGFPPGFVSKFKHNEKSFSTPKVVAQVSGEQKSTNVENMLGSVSKDQIQQFIALFTSQLQPCHSTRTMEASTSNTGISFSSSTYSFVGILMVAQHTLSSQTWVVDSGATHHVSHEKSLSTSIDTTVESYVNLPTGSTIKISGVGKVQLNSHISLSNVLYIPEFRLNLLSISSLMNDLNSHVIFDPSSCMIQDHTRVLTIGQGRRVGICMCWIQSLYKL